MRNQQGFSLVEVMLVMGLMGMAAMVFISMQKLQSRSQVTASTQFEIFNLMQDIQLSLLNSKACMQTLTGLKLSASEPTSLESIKSSTGESRYSVGIKPQGSRITLSGLNITPTDIELGIAGQGLVDLTMEIEKNSEQVQGTKMVNHRIALLVAIDESNNIIGCFSTFEAAVLKAKEETCLDLGGIYEDKVCKSIAPKINDLESVCDATTEGVMRYSPLTKSVFLCNGSKWMESVNFAEIGVKADGSL